MKKEDNNEDNLVRREWGQHSRVRNHHTGSCWIRRFTAHYSEKPRGKANADGPYQVSPYYQWLCLKDNGSVTAEFAIVLPGVLLVLFMALSVLNVQASRIALVEVAAEGSRAIARGESEQLVSQLLAEFDLEPNTTFHSSFKDYSVCLEVSERHELKVFGGLFPIEVKEVQCARKGGL